MKKTLIRMLALVLALSMNLGLAQAATDMAGREVTLQEPARRVVVLMAPEEDEDDEEGSVVIMKIEEQDGEDVYVSVDDDDVAQKVFDLFLEYLDEEEEGEE